MERENIQKLEAGRVWFNECWLAVRSYSFYLTGPADQNSRATGSAAARASLSGNNKDPDLTCMSFLLA